MNFLKQSINLLRSTSHQSKKVLFQQQRYFKVRKRFYKNVSITRSGNGSWEVNLDQRKLKTPSGRIFQVPNEPLALMIAEEWNAQHEVIQQSTMHLTSLCNTVQDNPNSQTPDSIVNKLLQYLESDTLCYFAEKDSELSCVQEREWTPILVWFRQHFNVELSPTDSILSPAVPQPTINTMHNYLHSYNFWSLLGFLFGVESIKSFILMVALVERAVDVEAAVRLSRLETEFQTSRWGKVEWAHDVDQFEAQARLAAALCFVRVNSYQENIVSKGTAS